MYKEKFNMDELIENTRTSDLIAEIIRVKRIAIFGDLFDS